MTESIGRSGYHGIEAKARAQELSGQVIGASIEVHRRLGPGLLESTYRGCLGKELKLRGIQYQSEVAVPISYRGEPLAMGFRLDLLVEDLVIVELKAVDRVEPVHRAQLLTYLRLSERWLGLLINFNSTTITTGLQRLLNG
ncbi:MAG TPA: GxxExxY protein [Candidatus Dormibacteraeota bacterium]|jgi:GxxExxY protein|nr:GxxExxY protein [Candidatus Dormibacteraeota bacterium]